MKMEYSELRRVYRLEKNSSKLVDVDDDFFSNVKEFFEKEKEQYLEAIKNADSSKTQDFENLQNLLKDFFDLREKKLLNKALISSRTNENNLTGLSFEEKKTFEKLLTLLKEHKNFTNGMFGETKSKPGREKKSTKTSLKILQEVPAFVGTDMKEYGPFSQDEQIDLNEKTASLLLKRGLAEKV